MSKNIENKLNYLTPFKMCIIQQFPFIEEDFDAVTNYQLLCKVVEYLNNTIKAVNELGEEFEVITNNFIQLKKYIDNYFNNLDVQEEINNKLDEMAKDGTLQAMIIDTYYFKNINVIYGYNENYKTHYYITHIPNKDENGNVIKIKHGFSDDNFETTKPTETAREFSKRKNATVVCNASPFFVDDKPHINYIRGLLIHNGKIIQDTRNIDEQVYRQCYILGIKNDNTLKVYEPFTDSDIILNDGIQETITGFTPIMKNGKSCKDELLQTSNWNVPYPKIFLGQNTTSKDFYILACNGKGVEIEKGLVNDDVIKIFQNIGVDFAYQFDGGGSTQLIYRNEMLNSKTDEQGYTERKVCDFIYFEKYEKLNNTQLSQKFSDILIGENKNNINNRTEITGLLKLFNVQEFPKGIEVFNLNNEKTNKLTLEEEQFNYWNYNLQKNIFATFKDDTILNGTFQTYDKTHGWFPATCPLISKNSILKLNDLTYSTIVYVNANADNSPFATENYNCFVLNLSYNNMERNDTIMQFAIPFGIGSTNIGIKTRRKIDGNWSIWENFFKKETEWETLTNDYGSLNYKFVGNILFLNGSFSNFNTNLTLKIPDIYPKQQNVFLCAGSGGGADLTITKAWVTVNGDFVITPGENTNSTYNINTSICIK